MSIKEKKQNWQPLRELALNTPYTMGYLSLMARRKQLRVRKVGRVWHSTMENIKEFEEKMRERKEQRKKQLQDSYREKVKREVLKEIENESDQLSVGSREKISQATADRPKIKENDVPSFLPTGGQAGKLQVLSSEDTIFDEVQRELEEVLREIRNREKRLRQEYLAYRGIHGRDGTETYGNAALAKERQETEEISENLIMDLGKLLNTANKIHEEEASGEVADNLDNSTYQEVSIPVKNKNVHHAPRQNGPGHGGIRTMDMDLPNEKDKPRKYSDKMHNIGHKDNFLSVPYSSFPFENQMRSHYSSGWDETAQTETESSQNKLLLFIAGLLVFIASVLLVLVIFG